MEQHTNQKPPCILLVDGDSSSRVAFEEFFTRVGWHYDLVGDPSQALEATHHRSYDLIIADILLFGQESAPFMKMVRDRSPTQPVIMITRNLDQAEKARLLKEGVSSCIDKPLDSTTLEQSVNQIISDLGIRDQKRQQSIVSPFAQTECFTTAELVASGYPFTALNYLLEADRIDLATKLKMTLALQEAIANCIEHGNLALDSKWREEFGADGIDRYSRVKQERLENPHYALRTVTIHTSFDDEKLLFRITDEGKGFLSSDVLPITTSSRELPCYGRGVAIMNGSMDEVSYALRGRQITLVKYISRVCGD